VTEVAGGEGRSWRGSGLGRPVPVPREGTAPFWAGGAVGELRIQQCQTCLRLVHPPATLCPYDHQRDLGWIAVSGNGHVESWTESQYSWVSGIPAPYLIAIVALDEDPSARLLTNLVAVSSDAVRIGMAVHVRFLELSGDNGPVYLPLFAPREDCEASVP
jgi:uncharacterized OB-fold protein